MIKFFRKIRQKLLQENRFSKYLLYAIGEIVLVVIGILIALQINNWNEAKKDSEVESIYIKNIIEDLNDQLNSIERQIKREEEFFSVSQNILEDYYEKNTLILDSIFFDKATRLTIRVTFSVIDPTFTDLVSSGNIKLIKDVSKKDRIIKYYQSLERVETIIQNNNSLLIDQNFNPTYLKIGYLNPSTFQGYRLITEQTKISDKLMVPSQKLMEHSADLLDKKDELQLVNSITQRHIVTNAHITFMNTQKELTLELIELLTND